VSAIRRSGDCGETFASPRSFLTPTKFIVEVSHTCNVALNVTDMVVGGIFLASGVALAIAHRSPSVGDGISGFFARGRTPPPIKFGPFGVLAMGIVCALIGAGSIAVSLRL
jgi:hypothetical protein